jgi:hypothetical protein
MARDVAGATMNATRSSADAAAESHSSKSNSANGTLMKLICCSERTTANGSFEPHSNSRAAEPLLPPNVLLGGAIVEPPARTTTRNMHDDWPASACTRSRPTMRELMTRNSNWSTSTSWSASALAIVCIAAVDSAP